MSASSGENALREVEAKGLAAIEAARDAAAIEAARVKYVGRSGELREAMKLLRTAPAEERPALGKLANVVKEKLTAAIEARREALAPGGASAGGGVDVTRPGEHRASGHLHPLTQIEDELKHVFACLGFKVAEGPEVETERHNFSALNIPLEHPSRDAFDTFYVSDRVLLRSHTSTVQIRVMESGPPPVRVVMPGRVYRPDRVDATHHYCFHQIEGLAVDENICFADLKAVLNLAMRALFGKATRTRFRPSFFPFTEPSAEVDISCPFCGDGCGICKGSGWIEVLGAGMVDPAVFEAVGYDPERYTGFAFGIGVERTAMRLHGIADMRLFFENDIRFLTQF